MFVTPPYIYYSLKPGMFGVNIWRPGTEQTREIVGERPELLALGWLLDAQQKTTLASI